MLHAYLSIAGRLYRAASLLIAVALLAACSSTPTVTDEPVAAIQLPNMLTETNWAAVSIYGNAASAADSILRISNDNRVTGYSGCNSFNGSVTIEGAGILFSKIASTRMLCAPAVSGQELAFLDALQATSGWRRSGNRLEFTAGDSTVIMQLVETND